MKSALTCNTRHPVPHTMHWPTASVPTGDEIEELWLEQGRANKPQEEEPTGRWRRNAEEVVEEGHKRESMKGVGGAKDVERGWLHYTM